MTTCKNCEYYLQVSLPGSSRVGWGNCTNPKGKGVKRDSKKFTWENKSCQDFDAKDEATQNDQPWNKFERFLFLVAGI